MVSHHSAFFNAQLIRYQKITIVVSLFLPNS